MNIEDVLTTLKVSLYHQTFRKAGANELGQPKYDYGLNWWFAESKTPRKESAEGETPTIALQNLCKKLGILT